ncbi:MAG: ABC transporter ATP-binding protein [Ruminococcus sp.]|jgi:ABC-2 type transport system ATP-binding protein
MEIVVQDVTMRFRRAKAEVYSLKEAFIQKIKGQTGYDVFTALSHVSFSVAKGEVLGIVGTNGSGKSTILKIISGALIPTEGQVFVDREKVQLLTLGTGFDLELTGRENVYLNGALIGHTREFLDEKYEEIVRFAQLEGFMDEKVRKYSSGMVSRLGFSIATAGDTPEILILDEVLSVGDRFFREKSERRIRKMIRGGSTVLMVSHSTSAIKKNCTRAIWIEKGRVRMEGTPEQVCEAYESMGL